MLGNVVHQNSKADSSVLCLPLREGPSLSRQKMTLDSRTEKLDSNSLLKIKDTFKSMAARKELKERKARSIALAVINLTIIDGNNKEKTI
jgi:hypothetical protein